MFNGVHLLDRPSMANVHRLDMACLPLIVEMQTNGMLIDKAHFINLATKLEIEHERVLDKIEHLVGERFNPHSSDQVARVLFHELQLVPPGGQSVTPTGKLSTDDDILAAISTYHPIVPLIQNCRELHKIRTTYALPIPLTAGPDDRVHTLIKTTRTSTGRLATGDSKQGLRNLQNIPVRTIWGNEVRKGFIAAPGCVIVSLDLCFHPDTLVETLLGPRRIADIQTGDKVLTLRNGYIKYGEVTRSESRPVLPSYKLTFDNGESVISSSNHKWPVKTTCHRAPWETVEKSTENLEIGERMFACRTGEVGGYKTWYSRGNRYYTKQHKLIAEAFLGPRPLGYHIHHKDRCRTNNDPSNLEYKPAWKHLSDHSKANYREQDHTLRLIRLREGLKGRRSYFGPANPNSILREGEREKICALRLKGVSRRVLAERFGVCPEHITNILIKHKRKKRYKSQNHKLVKKEYVGLQPMHVLTVEPDHNYVLSCGVVTHNCQIEMVWAAHLSQCPAMMQIFFNNSDIHTMTAISLFRLDPLQIIPLMWKDKRKEAMSDLESKMWKQFKKEFRMPAKCFHPDTEVLTRNGWKCIIALDRGEEVIQAIPSGDGSVKLEWVVPLEVYTTTHNSGRLIHLHNQGMDLRVTPDHRMLGFTDYGAFRVIPASEFAGCGALRTWANAGVLEVRGRKVNEKLLRVAVALQADGSITKWGSIRFGFTKQRKIERMRLLLRAAGLPYREAIHRNGSNKPVTAFSVQKAPAALVACLLDSDKTLPWWWLDLSSTLRKVVLAEAACWDSRKVDRRYIYDSMKRKNVDVLQAIAAVTGLKATAVVKKTGLHELSVREHGYSRTENLKSDKLNFTDEVACLSVPSTFVLVRDGGIPIICGQTLGFGILFGQTGQGLQKKILAEGGPLWTVEACDKFIDGWYTVYPEIKGWMQLQFSKARRYGMVWDNFGRIRRIPGAQSVLQWLAQAALREAGNMPITGSAQGTIKMAMGACGEIVRRFQRLGRCLPLMQIHDELLFEVERQMAEEFIGEMRRLMESVVQLSVPVRSSGDYAENWGGVK